VTFSFYWHDYETFGIDAALDRPCQFAGLRTDAELNEIGEPLVVYCRPPSDYLPQPRACLVTGITPQEARDKGLCEAAFAAAIEAELARPGTCGVGYNSIRFDDEFTRHLLFRNLYDPYAREWRSGNSRWDLIDVLRMTCALRPEGIEWPRREDGTPSFRLEDLTAANGIAHEGAHDALVDVRATVALARLLRERQPKLWDYALSLRSKARAAELLDWRQRRPVLHVSARYPAAQGCTALVAPLARHPVNGNSVIVWNLMEDPEPLLTLDGEQLRERLYAPAGSDLPRPALKQVRSNHSPMLATPKLLDAAAEARLGIDRERCEAHWQRLRDAPGLEEKLAEVFQPAAEPAGLDPEQRLYGAFVPDADRATLERLRALPPEELADAVAVFSDERLPALLFRYRARNFPATLTPQEREDWREHCRDWLQRRPPGGQPGLDAYRRELASLRDAGAEARSLQVLDALAAYADELAAALEPGA
jgi:exodeoxyribonuclease-1